MIYTPNPNMIFEGRFTYGYGAIYIDTVGLLIASVLSKKIAAGSTHVVIDNPVGATAKVRSDEAPWKRKIADGTVMNVSCTRSFA